MADRTPQNFTETVLAPTYYAASGGGDRSFPNGATVDVAFQP